MIEMGNNSNTADLPLKISCFRGGLEFLFYNPWMTSDLYFSFLQPSGQPLDSETHGGDDVGIWAVGPMSHLIHGTHQQSYIAHVKITYKNSKK